MDIPKHHGFDQVIDFTENAFSRQTGSRQPLLDSTQAPEERRPGRGGDRRGCAALEHALRGGQKCRTSNACGRFSGTPIFRRAMHAADQRSTRSSGGVRAGRREGPRQFEIPREYDGRRESRCAGGRARW
jgi:hypothetical protein